MKCRCYTCEHNTIHDTSRQKGYCSLDDVEIDALGKCDGLKEDV